MNQSLEILSKKKAGPSWDINIGKMAPNAIELEEVVLGAMMLEKEAFDEVSEILNPKCFYSDKNAEIFKAAVSLAGKNMPIDIRTMVEELQSSGKLESIGGPYELVKLTDGLFSAANIKAHAMIVFQKFIQRELIKASGEIIQMAYEAPDAFELLDYAERSIGEIGANYIDSGMVKIDKVVVEAFKKIQEWRGMETNVTGVPSGFSTLDRATRGWQPGDLIVIAARPSVGKCLGIGTKIIMFDGTLKKVEDIKVGDQIMGDDSNPRNILSLSRGKEMMYTISQVRGISYRVNESHIISVMSSRNEGQNKHGDKIDIPLTEYLSKSKKFKNNWKGYKTGIDFKEQELTIPPYMLGLWLGDGTISKPEISKPDDEIMHYMAGYAEGSGIRLRVNDPIDRCRYYNLVSKSRNKGLPNFTEKLKALNVFGNKHIPHEYLINSRENRLKLLAGLLDTDGYLIPTGGYEITQKSKTLIVQIKYLCDTLGFRTNLVEKISSIKSTGFIGVYHRLTIYGDIWNIPLKIKRKIWHRELRTRDHLISGITIEKDCVDDYYGFVIDGNHRFLLEDGTVTHNTAFALNLIRKAVMNKDKPISVAVWSLEMKAVHLVLRMLSSESKITLYKIQTGKLSDEEMNELAKGAGAKLSRLGIFFNDKSKVTIRSITRKARKLKKTDNLGLIVIDYLQLMKGESSGNREREIAEISRELKSLAQELEIPIIALSQLSREMGSKNINWEYGPPISSIRESGSVEQDADVIIMLWGPGDDDINKDPTLANKRKARIAKQRNGVLLTEELNFKNEIQLFEKISDIVSPINFKPLIEAEREQLDRYESRHDESIDDLPF